MKFTLGGIVATPGTLRAVPTDELVAALRRHAHCDWGDVDDSDKRANDAALENGERLVSSYKTASGVKFWIITEAEPRAVTTFLLPEEY